MQTMCGAKYMWVLRRAFFATLLAIVLCMGTCSRAMAAEPLPTPTQNFYVYDGAGVLTTATEEHVVSTSRQLYTQCKAEVVVATVDFLNGEDAESYARRLFNEWGIGDAKTNRGVLLLLSIGDGKYWAVAGSGLEDSLDSGTLGLILDENLSSAFDAGQYDVGVHQTYDALVAEVSAIYNVTASARPSATGGLTILGVNVNGALRIGFTILGILLALAVVGIVIFVTTRRRRQQRDFMDRGVYPGDGYAGDPNGDFSPNQSSYGGDPNWGRNRGFGNLGGWGGFLLGGLLGSLFNSWRRGPRGPFDDDHHGSGPGGFGGFGGFGGGGFGGRSGGGSTRGGGAGRR